MGFVAQFTHWSKKASVEMRVKSVLRLVARSGDYGNSPLQTEICHAIMHLVVKDKNAYVRKHFSNALSILPNPPKAVLWQLSQDIPEVAKYIYRNSQALTSHELINAIETRGDLIQISIANRGFIELSVIEAFIEKGGAAGLAALLARGEMQFSADFCHRIAQRLKNNELQGRSVEIRNKLLAFNMLYAKTRQLLIAQLTQELANKVIEKKWLAKNKVLPVFQDYANKATLELSPQVFAEINSYCHHLLNSKQLSVALLLRALAGGHILLFCVSLSLLSGKDIKKIKKILTSAALHKIDRLLLQCGFGENSLLVFQRIIIVLRTKPEFINFENSVFLRENDLDYIISNLPYKNNFDKHLLSILQDMRLYQSQNETYFQFDNVA